MRLFARARKLAAAVLVAGILSCAYQRGPDEQGPLFEPLEPPPPDRALVYIYRAPVPYMWGPGYSTGRERGLRPYVVHANERPIVRLVPGGYIWFKTSRRTVEFWAHAETTASITLDLEPGRTYYLRGGSTFGVLEPRPQLVLMPEDVALQEIKNCRLFGAPDPDAPPAPPPPRGPAAERSRRGGK